ncbi:protease HtpX, MEROPS family M48B [Abditibacterium utsteinense]|uniref:Protease HtpX homolog n=1 Tax=Abditibacterium utsteinense TaxID=1960156 RepID=A0A2S8SWL1_9BACT|nr:zinc metalloprotease HtpX [Abditibacterium utsteinense]PQV65164.1 protease HtpX, MEROPS family M48B [Abditibacterium utsteinense]
MQNTLKVGLMLTILTAFFVLMGRAIGGSAGMIFAFGFAILMNAGSYWFSDKIVLKMTGAQPVDQHSAPEFFRLTQNLVQRANLPMPALYIIDDPQPNAFATGRDPKHAAVAVNTGLLNLLSHAEIEGVVAHELAHVKHRDTLTMTVVATLAGAIMLMAQFGHIAAMFGGGRDNDRDGANPFVFLAMIIVGPLAASLVQMGVSRAREYEADALAARLTGSPHGLIGALTKLEQGAARIPTHSMSPQTAHLCIVNPFSGGRGAALANLFSTHPPMEKRIAALSKMTPQPVSTNPWS